MAHDSIKILLDSIERDYGKRPTHSELARALNVSEQVVTNWAKRGISVDGALAAQFAFQKDANYLLGRINSPMMQARQQPSPFAQHHVATPIAAYISAPGGGHLENELLQHFRRLDDTGKAEALNFVKVFAAGRSSQQDGQGLQVAG
jgi:hypothetical protein